MTTYNKINSNEVEATETITTTLYKNKLEAEKSYHQGEIDRIDNLLKEFD